MENQELTAVDVQTYAQDMNPPDVKRAARLTRNITPLRFLARAGFAVNGVVSAIIGVIALGIAATGGGNADQSGAFGAITATPGGFVALWAITIALAALGLWYLLGSLFVYGKDTKRRAAKVVVEIGKGIAYLFFAVAAFSFVVGPGSGSADQARSLTAQLLIMPGGIFVIVLMGLLFCGIGAFVVWKGISRGFEEDIVVPSGKAGALVKGIGILGYVSRGIALFVVGVLFIVASFTVDPSKASGLDGALKALAALPFGKVILGVVGLGFIAYGIYSLLRSRLANLN